MDDAREYARGYTRRRWTGGGSTAVGGCEAHEMTAE